MIKVTTNMRTTTIKFPSGIIGEELLHYMGADDEQTLHQRPPIAQALVEKCFAGHLVEINQEELTQLIKEVDNAADIKRDHVDEGGDWNGLMQYNLRNFLNKLKNIKL